MSRRNASRAAAPASPILFPRNVPVPSRAEIEAMVEGLIAYLDGLDGDADFEEQHDAEHDEAERGFADFDAYYEARGHYV